MSVYSQTPVSVCDVVKLHTLPSSGLTFWQLEPVFHKWVYERRYRILYAASDKYSYFTGKLVRGNCSGSLSIQLLAAFMGI